MITGTYGGSIGNPAARQKFFWQEDAKVEAGGSCSTTSLQQSPLAVQTVVIVVLVARVVVVVAMLMVCVVVVYGTKCMQSEHLYKAVPCMHVRIKCAPMSPIELISLLARAESIAIYYNF